MDIEDENSSLATVLNEQTLRLLVDGQTSTSESLASSAGDPGFEVRLSNYVDCSGVVSHPLRCHIEDQDP